MWPQPVPLGYPMPLPMFTPPPLVVLPINRLQPPPATTNPSTEERAGALVPTSANATYNLNAILAGTITSSSYFLSLLSEYPTFEAVVDVIRDECVHIEAFEPGKAHLPSYAFCCMFKLFMSKLDTVQLNTMLRHKSVFVRCIGLLYLRCIGETSELMKWCEPHLEDMTLFNPSSDENARPITVSDWLLNCITDHKYYGTVLRRIPVPVVRAFERKGVELKIIRQRAEKLRKYLVVGLTCRCKWTDGKVYDAVIQKVLEGDRYVVLYPEYGNEDEVSIVDFDAESVTKVAADKRGRSPSEDRRSRSRDTKSRSRDIKSRSRDRERRKKSRRHSDSDSSPDRRSRSRSRSRSRDRSRDRSRERRRASRSRDRDSKRELTLEEEVEAQLKKKRESEKIKATTGDGKYCAQIVSYKKLLSKQFRGGETFDTTNKKLDLPDAHPPRGDRDDWRRERGRDRRRSRSPSPVKKKELTHEQKMKQAELLARYGDASHSKKKAADS